MRLVSPGKQQERAQEERGPGAEPGQYEQRQAQHASEPRAPTCRDAVTKQSDDRHHDEDTADDEDEKWRLRTYRLTNSHCR